MRPGGHLRLLRWSAPCALAAFLALVGAPSAAGAPAPPPGLVPASALLLYEQDTGLVVFERNGSEELPIASTTKLMTAFVAVKRARPGTRLTEQPYLAGPGESLAGVPAGTRLSLTDMLRAMLLPSGNDVAYSLAIDVGGTVNGFVALMNHWARVLRLGRTEFTGPAGLDTPRGNYSTALDLARLANRLLRDRLIASIVREPRARLADGLLVKNLNDLITLHPWIVGVKTGHTVQAGYCMVGAARLHGVRVLSVVLGAPSMAARDADTLALLRYGLRRFRRVQIGTAGHAYATVPVKGRARTVRLLATRAATLVLDWAVRLHVALIVPRRLVGPLPAGAIEGSIQVRENGRLTTTVALVTATAVPAPARPPKPRPVKRRESVLVWVAAGGGLSAVLLGCSLPLMRRRFARSALELP